jgi:hypothetical protein
LHRDLRFLARAVHSSSIRTDVLFRKPHNPPLGTCIEETMMFRTIFVALTFAAVGLMAQGSAFAQSHGHHRGYSHGGHSHHNHGGSGFVQLSVGNPYGYGYYGRPVYPSYGYGYYPAYPAYRSYYGGYGGCGGHGYPAYRGYGGGGFAIGFGF